MSIAAIAKKDFQDSARSKTLWAIIGLFLLVVGGIAYLELDSGSGDATDVIIGGTLVFGILLFVPLAGLFISVKSIVRERESGTINILLSLPHTRGEMVLGKFLGRSGVMAVSILVGFLPAIVLILMEADIPVRDLLVFLLVSILFGVMFIGIGVGFSALVTSETQATIGGIAIFFLLYLWPLITDEILSLVDYELPDFAARFWLFIMFGDMMESLASDGAGLTEPSSIVFGESSVAFYMQNWFVFAILALWVAVPMAIGYLRFKTTDL